MAMPIWSSILNTFCWYEASSEEERLRVASTAWVLERSPTQALPCFTASHAYSIWWILPCEHGSSVSNAGSHCVGAAASRHSRPPDPRVRRRRGHQGHEARCESHLRAPRDAIRVVLRERGMYGSVGCGSPGRPHDKLVDETNDSSSGVFQSRSNQSPGCDASCDPQLCYGGSEQTLLLLDPQFNLIHTHVCRKQR